MAPGRFTPDLGAAGRPTTRFRVDSGTVISAIGCKNVQLHHIEVSGGDAGGILLRAAAARFENVRVIGNSNQQAGGGVRVDDASLVLRDSVVAANYSSVRGGGLQVEGIGSLDITDSIVSGNCAASLGGGLYVRDAAGVSASNVLFTANRARFGGGIKVVSNLGQLSNLTVAYNEATVSLGGAGLAVHAPADNVRVRDSIFVHNRDINGRTEAFNSTVTAPISDFNLLEQAPVGDNDIDIRGSGAGLADGYYLDQAGSPAVDSGRTTAADAGVDARFTDPAPDPIPDAGVVDRGYHYSGANAGAADSYLEWVNQETPRFCAVPADASAVVVVPLRQGARIGPGHRVVATLPPGNTGQLYSAADVDPLGDGRSVILVDLGDGRYLLYRSTAEPGDDDDGVEPITDDLVIYVDDRLVPPAVVQ